MTDTIIVGALFSLVGLVLFVVALFKESGWGLAVGFFFLVGLVVLLFGTNSDEFKFRNLLKEVNLREVSIVGKDQFNAQLRIVYESGKLSSVTLVPKTTVKIKTKETEEEINQ